ncbi:MAG TPA: phenylacetate--CoA ligase family protein [Proteobacteria bacterium]|nr:phenylacetate-coenzyme A ligase [bacterium BMS3Abin14]HDL52487.1 phenylacetate--CoA ligase family protein [Pseudomonadota bacterium]
MNNYRAWNESAEKMSRDELEQLQFERLQSTLNRVYRNVKFYQRRFDDLGLQPSDIRTMDDLEKIPFTTKDDLRENYPYGMLAVPLREVVRIHSSTGTTGKPTVICYSRNDLDKWSELVARILTSGGVTRDDVVQIAFGYGLFTGGFGLHAGAEKIGASVIPVSSGNTAKQLMIMEDYRTSALVCTPSYALFISEVMEKNSIDLRRLSLRYGLFGSEPWSERMRSELEEKLGIVATDNYGLSEVMGPGVAGECIVKSGLHLNEDHYLPEVIDPDTGERLPMGKVGELVITTITNEAMPLIRFRTRDLTRLYVDDCPCGRSLIKIEKVKGRSDDMIIIKGVNVFPSQVEEVLSQFEGVTPHYQIVLSRDGALDSMAVLVEITEAFFFDEMKKQRDLLDRIREDLRSTLGLGVNVKLVEPKTIERFEGKAQRVVDRREL